MFDMADPASSQERLRFMSNVCALTKSNRKSKSCQWSNGAQGGRETATLTAKRERFNGRIFSHPGYLDAGI